MPLSTYASLANGISSSQFGRPTAAPDWDNNRGYSEAKEGDVQLACLIETMKCTQSLLSIIREMKNEDNKWLIQERKQLERLMTEIRNNTISQNEIIQMMKSTLGFQARMETKADYTNYLLDELIKLSRPAVKKIKKMKRVVVTKKRKGR